MDFQCAKRRRVTSGHSSSESFTTSSSDSSTPSRHKTDRVTSWDRTLVEDKLGIVYAKTGSPDFVGLKQYINGTINDFSEAQRNYIEFIDKTITINRKLFHFMWESHGCETESQLAIVEEKIKELDEQNYNYVKIQEFIDELKTFHLKIKKFKQASESAKIPEEFLLPVLAGFARLCLLKVEHCNQADMVNMKLDGKLVSSLPDLRLKKFGLESKSSSAYYVSVTEVKKKRFKGSLRYFDVGMDKNEEIELEINDNTLGQHAGELLLDLHDKYKEKRAEDFEDNKKINMLGMIVEGTDVYFTVLEIKWKHYQKLKCNQKLEADDKATIYYSSPRNYLDQEDRSQLIRDFVSLNNIDY